jgi:hypothetical protein
MQEPKDADLEPAHIDITVTDTGVGFQQVKGCGAATPKQILTVAVRFEFPARLEQAAIALQGGGKSESPIHDGPARRYGIDSGHQTGP